MRSAIVERATREVSILGLASSELGSGAGTESGAQRRPEPLAPSAGRGDETLGEYFAGAGEMVVVAQQLCFDRGTVVAAVRRPLAGHLRGALRVELH